MVAAMIAPCSDTAGRRDLGQRMRLDATGRDAFLSSRKRLRRKNREHQSAAIFGHFRGAEYRPGEDAGNISIYRFEHGWMWMIRLPNAVMSVGAVCRPAYLKQRKGNAVDFLLETLKRNKGLRQRIERAELIGNEVRVTGNYSYDSTRMGGPGWVMIGDAFAFLDPVFSSGVYLAMNGAEQAAQVVDIVLREPQREASLLRKLEKRQRAGMATSAGVLSTVTAWSKRGCNLPVAPRLWIASSHQIRSGWEGREGTVPTGINAPLARILSFRPSLLHVIWERQNSSRRNPTGWRSSPRSPLRWH
jgi:flavin-dependent dehydrogenase